MADASQVTNRILRALAPSTLARLLPGMEAFDLRAGAVIDHVDGPIEHMYFINRGLVSLVKVMHDGRSVEVGAIGIEGVTDSNALFGVDVAVIESMVQIPGTAFRVSRDFLGREMAHDAGLRRIMERYTRFAFGQLAQTAACNRLHSLDERCCRWLLTSHDSALADSFPLTHEFLATMLGATRSSVSLAAKTLQRAGLIEYTRGVVAITDRSGLEDVACECYRETSAELDKLFSSPEQDRRQS